MDNTLEGINSRITEAEEQINDLQDRMVEITATEQNIEETKEMKTKETLMYRTVLWTLWERERVGRFGRMTLKHV